MVTAAKVVPDFHDPSCSSFPVSMRSSRVSPFNSSVRCIKKISLGVFQNSPGLPVPCCTALQQMLGLLKTLMRTRTCEQEASTSCLRKAYLRTYCLCIPDQTICSRLPPQCHHKLSAGVPRQSSMHPSFPLTNMATCPSSLSFPKCLYPSMEHITPVISSYF